MSRTRNEQDVTMALSNAIYALFGPEVIDRISVIQSENENGEPALSVTVHLKAAQMRMPGRVLLDSLEAASAALREMEDYRFPYVTFLAPEDEAAEDTRPAA